MPSSSGSTVPGGASALCSVRGVCGVCCPNFRSSVMIHLSMSLRAPGRSLELDVHGGLLSRITPAVRPDLGGRLRVLTDRMRPFVLGHQTSRQPRFIPYLTGRLLRLSRPGVLDS